MMKTFKSQMKKEFYKNGKLKQYSISMGVNTEINEDLFQENENGKMVCDVVICFPDEFKKLTEEHQKFQAENQTLKKTLEEKKKSLEIAENKLSNIEGKHQKEMQEMKEEYSRKIDGLNEDLHEKDLEREKTIGDLKEKYQSQIGDLKEKTQKDLNGLELFDEDKHMLIKDHNDEISSLKLFDEEYHMKKEDHQKALNDMRGNCLKLRVRDNKEYSAYLEKLDRLGKLDKLRNKDKPIIKEMMSFNNSIIDEEAIDVDFNLIEKKE